MNDFYVYGYLRSKDSTNGPAGSFYYIGKGRGRRTSKSHGFVPIPINDDHIVIIADRMSEDDAFQFEMLLIHLHGRIDLGTGCLRNMTDGGEGRSGSVCSEETKLRLSLAGMGHKVTEITRNRMSASRVGRVVSEEHRAKISSTKSGKPLTLSHREKISAAGRNRVQSPETRAKISAARKEYISRKAA